MGKRLKEKEIKELAKELGINSKVEFANLRKEMEGEYPIMYDGHFHMEKSVLREYGKPRSLQSANPMQCYLSMWPKFPDPSVLEIVTAEGETSYVKVFEYLASKGWTIAWNNSSYRTKEMERFTQIFFLNKDLPGYMIEMWPDWSLESSKRKKNYKKIEAESFPGSLTPNKNYKMTEGDSMKVDSITMFTPARTSPYWNAEPIEELIKFLESVEKPRKNEDAEVSIIVTRNGNYDIKSFSLSEANTSFILPDLHYGEGFEEFHNTLIKRLDEDSKGLVLFHGDPGTGKTQYIRHLLKELCGADKAVLYSPPAVSASLAEPAMINFISDWIMGEHRDCILLIEDAEPLLESRSGGVDGRSTGISNLLNITDGILNDILGLMVIATFNIEISKIDPALLRPGRLIARKEFKRMDELQTENLANALGMEAPDIELKKYPITLAEFYNNSKAKNVITHEYKEGKRNSIGFK